MKKIVLLSIFILIASACNTLPQIDQIEFSPNKTLTVLAPNLYTSVLKQAERAMSNAWAEEGREFILQISSYNPSEREQQLSRLQTMIMAGQSYDMFVWDGHPLWIHSNSGFFADFYTLIDQSPNTKLDDFYTNVLEAWEFDGGLYIFPLSFELTYVGISAELPQSFIDRFNQHSTITTKELMEIYLDLQREHWQEVGNMAFGAGFYIQDTLGSFINFESSRATINDFRLVEYLENMRQISNIEIEETELRYRGYNYMMEELSQQYVFLQRYAGISQISVLFDPPNPAFLNYIPVTDEYGRAILRQNNSYYYFNDWGWAYDTSPFWGSLSISSNGESALAWEFTQQLISAMISHDIRDVVLGEPIHYHRHFGNHNLIMPIKRAYTELHVRRIFDRYFEDMMTAYGAKRRFYGIPSSSVEMRPTLDEAIARLEAFNNMPMVLKPYLPANLYQQPIEDFMLGLTSAWQAAEEINNRIGLWLIE